MPIYKTKILGTEKVRLVRADTAAKARDVIVGKLCALRRYRPRARYTHALALARVPTESVTAEELADLIDQGVEIEKAAEKVAAEPAPGTENA